MIRFSIITVVRNDPVGVTRTLQSVFEQTYPHYESIVQDGASTDSTSDVLRGLEPWIDSLTIERDGGIYDAMNRALRRATGDYLLFMNAADFFINPKVLETVAKLIDPAQDDILVGKAIRDEDGKIHAYRKPEMFWAGSTCDHQATFIRRELMQELEYSTAYKIAGDLHFFTRARQQGARFRFVDNLIARKPFSYGASVDFVERVRDRLAMLEAAGGTDYQARDLITKEMRADTARTYGLDADLVEDWSLDALLAARADWQAKLAS
jgi:glycosyltransferase involved in cell wall biosynthesis